MIATPVRKPRIKTAKKILLDAANLLERKGWIKGSYRSPQGYCAIGAIKQASGVDTGVTARKQSYEVKQAKWKEYERAFEAMSRATKNNIAGWNDAKTRTKEQVITKLREIAGKL